MYIFATFSLLIDIFAQNRSEFEFLTIQVCTATTTPAAISHRSVLKINHMRGLTAISYDPYMKDTQFQ